MAGRAQVFKKILGRLSEQRTLMEATKHLRSRPKSELEGMLPEDLPPVVKEDPVNPAKTADLEVKGKKVDDPRVNDGFEGDPFDPVESRKLIAAAGEPIEGEVFSTLNVKRIKTDEDVAGFVIPSWFISIAI